MYLRSFLWAFIFTGLSISCSPKDSSVNCSKLLEEVIVLPFHAGTSVDGSYNMIITIGKNEGMTTCLLENISDTSRIDDVRESQVTQTIARGDVSVFLLSEIYEIPLADLLPDDTKYTFADMGVFAYHRYSETEGARDEIKDVFKKKNCAIESSKKTKLCSPH